MNLLPRQRLYQLKSSIRTVLITGFTAVTLLFVITAIFILTTLNSYQESLKAVRELDATAVSAQTVRALLASEGLAFSSLILRQDANLEGPYRLLNGQLREQIPALLTRELTTSEQGLLTYVASQHPELSKLYDQAIVLANNHNFEALNTSWANEIQPLLDLVLARTNRLSELLIQRANTNATMADKAVAERQQWMVIALVIATILSLTIAAITIRISIYQNRQLQATLTQLEVANRKIQERQETSEAVSKEVLQLSAELKSNANQQATGSQQQLAVVSQVNTTVIKLSNTAAGIAKLSAKISEVAVGVATDSQQIEQTTGLSAEQSQQGVAALNSAIQVSEELALLYQQLMETFNTLRSKATNMRRILELLHSITTETHLLSLNAAIEAAGSGQNGTRFRVVAQEVKNLALRSSQSNQEVIGIVRELESVVDEALTSVESGHHKTEEMKEVVGEASTVIEKMRTVSEHSQQQANTINQAVQEAKVMMDEIKFATSQQQNASQQVCEVLNGLSVVAQQTAVGSNLVALTAVDLEKLSNQLNLALANA